MGVYWSHPVSLSVCLFVFLSVTFSCGANYFLISYPINLKLHTCIHVNVQMCVTYFSCVYLKAVKSYLPLNNLGISLQDCCIVYKLCGANSFHISCGANYFLISYPINLKLHTCIHVNVQMCVTYFSCVYLKAVKSYLPLNNLGISLQDCCIVYKPCGANSFHIS